MKKLIGNVLYTLIIAFIMTVSPFAARAAPPDTIFNVTQTGNYQIAVRGGDGGSGGSGTAGPKGGSGATLTAIFALQANDVLRLVTGDTGIVNSGPNGDGGGGGGGSAVILTRGGTSSLLIVAGGGGGTGTFNINDPGATGIGGNSSNGTPSGGTSSLGTGGGGFNAPGAVSGFSGIGGGAGTLATGGGAGSPGVIAFGDGSGGYGFGGGGSGSGSVIIGVGGGGGGGGYGGGNGGDPAVGGGGGSSFVATTGSAITRTNGTNGGGTARNGSVSVVALAPTAAAVSVGGRVLTMSGRGILNVRLSLTDSSGQVRTTVSTSFGYYRFDDVQVGETYILSATGKHYTFSQPVQVLNINDETNGVNFIANSERRKRIF